MLICWMNCYKRMCLEMMPSCRRQVNCGNCGIPWVNCAVLCVKDDGKGQFWGLRYCLSKLPSFLCFPRQVWRHTVKSFSLTESVQDALHRKENSVDKIFLKATCTNLSGMEIRSRTEFMTRAVCVSLNTVYNTWPFWYWYICQLQFGWHPVAVHIWLTPGGSTHLHTNNTQNITINNKTTRITNKTTQIINLEEWWPCPVFGHYTLAFSLHLREKHGKTSVRVAEEIRSIHFNKTPAYFRIL
jgi:hypothetical protein